MSDERLEAIRERLNTRGGYSKTAYFDIDYLLDRIEAQREVVEAAREVADTWGEFGVQRLRHALEDLEEQTDD